MARKELTAEEMEDLQEEVKAARQYAIQKATFRAALDKGKHRQAAALADRYNWPTDMVDDELASWLYQG